MAGSGKRLTHSALLISHSHTEPQSPFYMPVKAGESWTGRGEGVQLVGWNTPAAPMCAGGGFPSATDRVTLDCDLESLQSPAQLGFGGEAAV